MRKGGDEATMRKGGDEATMRKGGDEARMKRRKRKRREGSEGRGGERRRGRGKEAMMQEGKKGDIMWSPSMFCCTMRQCDSMLTDSFLESIVTRRLPGWFSAI